MDILFSVMTEVVTMLLFICIQTFFYFRTIGASQKWRGLRLAFIVLLISIIASASQLASISVVTLHWAGNLILIIYILYPVIFMGGKFKERIFFGIVNLAVFMFSILITGIITRFEKLAFNWTQRQEMILVAGLMIFIYAILVLIIAHLSTEGKRYIPRKYWTSMILCFSIILIGLFIISSLKVWVIDAEKLRTYLVIFTMGLLVIWLMAYFIFYFVCRYFSKTAEARTMAIQNDMIERYMLKKQTSDERISLLSHDLKHSLIQWRTLAEGKGDAKILQSISEYEGQLHSTLLYNVENENANAIINQKHWEANQEQVKFSVDGVFHKDILVSKLDLCSLLGNLLDNAVEAASQAEADILRRVKLSIRRKGHLLILMVENGYAKEPILENGIFLTSKKDKHLHALGMMSIRYVAEKYDGVVNNSYKNNWFKATIMLKGYHTALSDEK